MQRLLPRCEQRFGSFVSQVWPYSWAALEYCRRMYRLSKPVIAFRSVYRLGVYEGRLRDAILKMKAGMGDALSQMMGRVSREALLDRLLAARIDQVVPVPLHWRREWARGHNQSLELAEELAIGLGVPCLKKCLQRIRHTPQQLQPSASARRENVRGAFRVRRGANLSGKRILLVDDVMTTGSTASEAARMLLQVGAKEVVVAILCEGRAETESAVLYAESGNSEHDSRRRLVDCGKWLIWC